MVEAVSRAAAVRALAWIAAGLLAGANNAHAQENGAAASSPAPSAEVCHTAAGFEPPRVAWMGKFAYKTVITIQGGRMVSVEVTPFRGTDPETDRIMVQAIKAYIEANYSCQGPDQVFSTYLVVTLKHEVPELADLTARLQAERMARKNAGLPVIAGLEPASGEDRIAALQAAGALVCRRMEKPVLPRINGTGSIHLHAVAEIRGGAVGVIDVKVMAGSPNPAVNQVFIDSVIHAIRDGYQCDGTHVFEQEFFFKIS